MDVEAEDEKDVEMSDDAQDSSDEDSSDQSDEQEEGVEDAEAEKRITQLQKEAISFTCIIAQWTQPERTRSASIQTVRRNTAPATNFQYSVHV